MTTEECRQQAAHDVLGYMKVPGGWTPGGFTTKLIEAWLHADPANRFRLSLGFPILCEALALSLLNPEKLQEWAGLK